MQTTEFTNLTGAQVRFQTLSGRTVVVNSGAVRAIPDALAKDAIKNGLTPLSVIGGTNEKEAVDETAQDEANASAEADAAVQAQLEEMQRKAEEEAEAKEAAAAQKRSDAAKKAAATRAAKAAAKQ